MPRPLNARIVMTSAVGWRWRIIFIWLGQLLGGEHEPPMMPSRMWRSPTVHPEGLWLVQTNVPRIPYSWRKMESAGASQLFTVNRVGCARSGCVLVVQGTVYFQAVLYLKDLGFTCTNFTTHIWDMTSLLVGTDTSKSTCTRSPTPLLWHNYSSTPTNYYSLLLVPMFT
ncbi:hypothetical protein IWW34DRAFT_96217 [Fusarium oxysporum f. sp. albedinis]|nr:hypothetical protein IWW34DRAFT_96217 [Fusarium oxysporum f. sp. albedinis]